MRLYQRGKGGIWWIDITVKGHRVTRSSGTQSRAAAEEWAAAVQNDLWRQRKLGETTSVTWGYVVLDWLDKHAEERRSIETIKGRLRWLTEHLEQVQIAQLSRATVDKLMEEKRAGGASAATCNRYIAEVSKILHHARREGWANSVPLLRRYKEPRNAIRWLTREEARSIIAELPPHLADMARVALATGLRESNVRLLRWNQVDLDRAVAWIEGADTKSGEPLNVPLNPDAMDVLRRRRGDHKRFVFVYMGQPISTCSRITWHKAVARAGVQDLRWHDLRHTWASWHVQDGTPLPMLQKLGGWASYSMVLRYSHLGTDHVAAYANASLLGDKSVTSSGEDASMGAHSIDNIDKSGTVLTTVDGLEIPRHSAKVLNLKDALAPKRRKTA